LHQLGITRIGQLEALPREALSSRFGPQLLRRLDQASGRLPEPIPARRPAVEFAADFSPPQPTARREAVEGALEQLIGQVAEQLARADRGAVKLECCLECSLGGIDRIEPVRVCLGLFRPTAAADYLFQLARLQFERLPAPVAAMRVTAPVTAPLEHRQQELFPGDDDTARRNPRQLAALVDRLSSRLGRRSVCSARLVSDAQPERAWRRDPLIEGSRRRRPTVRSQRPAKLPPRPLRLFPRPISLTTVASKGPPPHFHFRNQPHKVVHHWGPERIETGWWRGHTVGRDYYRLETTAGRRYWVFRRLRDGRWFVHGTFE